MKELTLKNSKKEYISFSAREEKDGITKNINVKQVENGFVVDINMYGRVTKGGKEEYIDDSKTYISTTNPLTSKGDSMNTKDLMKKALENLTV